MTLNPHLPVCMAGSPAGLTEHPLHLYPLKEDAVGCQGVQVGRPHGGVEEELGVGCQQLKFCEDRKLIDTKYFGALERRGGRYVQYSIFRP